MGFEERVFDGAQRIAAKSSAVMPWSRRGATTLAADVLVVPITHAFVSKTTGADAEVCLIANGSPGQELTVLLVDNGTTGQATVAPATSTGWTAVVLADNGDAMHIRYINDTIGWILLSTYGASAPPVAVST